MASITIVSGCPGSGKTTIAKLVAERKEMGVCIETDKFHHFLAHRIDPSTPESKSQNIAVTRSFLHSAQSFYADGYDVVLDGVIGPWWLDLIEEVTPNYQYAILHASLDVVVQRTQERAKRQQASAHPELVRIMHDQFDAIDGMEQRTLDTSNKRIEEVVEEFIDREKRGHFQST